jgi:hypothetical protein
MSAAAVPDPGWRSRVASSSDGLRRISGGCLDGVRPLDGEIDLGAQVRELRQLLCSYLVARPRPRHVERFASRSASIRKPDITSTTPAVTSKRNLSQDDRAKVYERNARRVYPRLDPALTTTNRSSRLPHRSFVSKSARQAGESADLATMDRR